MLFRSGVGGAITGKGGHLIIDDPVKNREEAESLTIRDTIWNWYTSTAYTRLPPNGWIVDNGDNSVYGINPVEFWNTHERT